MQTNRKKVIDLFTTPRPYRPEPLQKRLEREKNQLEQLDKERFQRLAEARRKLNQNKKDRE